MKTQILNFSDRVTALAYNGHLLAVGLDNGIIKIYEYQFGTYVLLREWEGYTNWISSLVFTTDGSLVSASYDGFLKKWDVETERVEKLVSSLQWERDLCGGLMWSVAEISGGCLAASSHYGIVHVLDMSTGLSPSKGEEVCRGHTGWVSSVISLEVVGDRAGSFASGSYDRTIRVWTTSPIGRESATYWTLERVVEVGSSVRCMSLSSCEKMVAVGCDDGFVRLFRLPKWNLFWKGGPKNVHTRCVISMTFSPDGRFLASGSFDHLVKILSTETGAVLRTLKGHSDFVQEVIFSQDGLSVISGSDDKTIRVWRLVEQDDRIASLLSGRTSSDLIYQGEDVFKQLFTTIRTKLIGF